MIQVVQRERRSYRRSDPNSDDCEESSDPHRTRPSTVVKALLSVVLLEMAH
jgi:hypothetical protein